MGPEPLGVAEVGHEDGKHGVAMKRWEVVSLEEGVDHQLPVQTQLESVRAPMLVITELQCFQFWAEGTHGRIGVGRLQARSDPNEPVLLAHRKLS